MRSGGRSGGCCSARLASTSSIASILLHLLLELAQLPVRSGLARRVVQIGLEQVALQIGVGAHPPPPAPGRPSPARPAARLRGAAGPARRARAAFEYRPAPARQSPV